jgi:hypothetical protein
MPGKLPDLSPEMIEKIIAEYKSGEWLTDLFEKYKGKASQTTIRRIVGDSIRKSGRDKLFDDATEKLIAKKYSEDNSVTQIALSKEFGCAPTTIRRILIDNKVIAGRII